MIHIKIDIWPRGDFKNAQCLHECVIANTGGSHNTGDYHYKVSKVGGFKTSNEDLCRFEAKNVLREGEVTGFPRLKLYAVDLLYRCLKSAIGGRNDGQG